MSAGRPGGDPSVDDERPGPGPADGPSPWSAYAVPPTGPDPAVSGPYAVPPTGPGSDPAVSGPYGGPYPGYPQPPYAAVPGRVRPKVWPPSRVELRTVAALLAGLAAVGALLGVLWEQLAPRLAYLVDQPGRALPVVPEAEEYVAADGRFVLLTLAAGVVAGLACWFVKRARGPVVLVGLAAAGLLGAVVTWRVGLALGTGYAQADLQEVGRTIFQPLTLKARAGLVVEPVAAVLVYLLAAGFSARNDLGREDPAPGPRVS